MDANITVLEGLVLLVPLDVTDTYCVAAVAAQRAHELLIAACVAVSGPSVYRIAVVGWTGHACAALPRQCLRDYHAELTAIIETIHAVVVVVIVLSGTLHQAQGEKQKQE